MPDMFDTVSVVTPLARVLVFPENADKTPGATPPSLVLVDPVPITPQLITDADPALAQELFDRAGPRIGAKALRPLFAKQYVASMLDHDGKAYTKFAMGAVPFRPGATLPTMRKHLSALFQMYGVTSQVIQSFETVLKGSALVAAFLRSIAENLVNSEILDRGGGTGDISAAVAILSSQDPVPEDSEVVAVAKGLLKIQGILFGNEVDALEDNQARWTTHSLVLMRVQAHLRRLVNDLIPLSKTEAFLESHFKVAWEIDPPNAGLSPANRITMALHRQAGFRDFLRADTSDTTPAPVSPLRGARTPVTNPLARLKRARTLPPGGVPRPTVGGLSAPSVGGPTAQVELDFNQDEIPSASLKSWGKLLRRSLPQVQSDQTNAVHWKGVLGLMIRGDSSSEPMVMWIDEVSLTTANAPGRARLTAKFFNSDETLLLTPEQAASAFTAYDMLQPDAIARLVTARTASGPASSSSSGAGASGASLGPKALKQTLPSELINTLAVVVTAANAKNSIVDDSNASGSGALCEYEHCISLSSDLVDGRVVLELVGMLNRPDSAACLALCANSCFMATHRFLCRHPATAKLVLSSSQAAAFAWGSHAIGKSLSFALLSESTQDAGSSSLLSDGKAPVKSFTVTTSGALVEKEVLQDRRVSKSVSTKQSFDSMLLFWSLILIAYLGLEVASDFHRALATEAAACWTESNNSMVMLDCFITCVFTEYQVNIRRLATESASKLVDFQSLLLLKLNIIPPKWKDHVKAQALATAARRKQEDFQQHMTSSMVIQGSTITSFNSQIDKAVRDRVNAAIANTLGKRAGVSPAPAPAPSPKAARVKTLKTKSPPAGGRGAGKPSASQKPATLMSPPGGKGKLVFDAASAAQRAAAFAILQAAGHNTIGQASAKWRVVPGNASKCSFHHSDWGKALGGCCESATVCHFDHG